MFCCCFYVFCEEKHGGLETENKIEPRDRLVADNLHVL